MLISTIISPFYNKMLEPVASWRDHKRSVSRLSHYSILYTANVIICHPFQVINATFHVTMKAANTTLRHIFSFSPKLPIHRPILNGLGDVGWGDGPLPFQVGDGAGDF